MNNILPLNAPIAKRITNWAKVLRKHNIQLIATVGLTPDNAVYVLFDEEFSKNEAHYLLEDALSQLEENMNMECEEDYPDNVVRFDIH